MAKRAIIRIGDPTSHGGTVLEGFETITIYGKNAAGIGHRGYCPSCKQDFIIVGGTKRFSYLGQNVALDGMYTSCGAVLIATQDKATVNDMSTANTTVSAMTSKPALSLVPTPCYDLQFQLQGNQSSRPLANVPYKLSLENGTEILGFTDNYGYTEKIVADQPLLATLIAPYYESNDTEETNADNGCDTCHSEAT